MLKPASKACRIRYQKTMPRIAAMAKRTSPAVNARAGRPRSDPARAKPMASARKKKIKL